MPVPAIMRQSMSRPYWSVPSRCAVDAGRQQAVGQVLVEVQMVQRVGVEQDHRADDADAEHEQRQQAAR